MKIIATDIANLTDARYFAAWGVEGMAFNMDPSASDSMTIDQVKEIVDWVEGPDTMIKMEGLDVLENLGEIQSKVDVRGVIVGPFIDTATLSNFDKIYRICSLEGDVNDHEHLILLLPFDFDKISTDQKEKIKSITSGREVFLDANFTSSHLDEIGNLGFTGIILKGGEEEKVGFKSYDELDEILEVISDNF